MSNSEKRNLAASVLTDKAYWSGRWANAMYAGRLQDEPTFEAYCELTGYGPANDWNGQRSAALRLYDEITTEIVVTACAIYRAKVNDAQNCLL
jgi:hypothetical protein